LVGIPQFLTI